MNQCYECGEPATRSCTDCGRFCCENHFGYQGHNGPSCGACQGSWLWAQLAIVVLGGLAILLVYFAYIKPTQEAQEKKMNEMGRQIEPGVPPDRGGMKR